MRYFNALILTISLVVSHTVPFLGWADKTLQEQVLSNPALSWQEVFNYAQENLPKKGRLILKSNGFAYLKVDDDYIHALFPMLDVEKQGFKEPPYFRTDESPGAHISVFYASENVRPEEVGQYFCFKLKQIVTVKTSNGSSYVVLQVESPDLEKLRAKYGLSPKLLGHEYHISLAQKTKHPSKHATHF